MSNMQPIVVRAAERQPSAATPGTSREQAFAESDRWIGYVRTEPGVLSGWHHHGETDSYFYVLRGSIELEFGPGGRQSVAVMAGDFALVPRGVIHREGSASDVAGEVVLVRIGHGPPVVNVEGPDPE